MLISWLLILAGALSLYILIVRPILHRWSVLDPYLDQADTFWAKVGEVLSGWKTILVARIQWLIGAFITVYAGVEPIIEQAFTSPGVDWQSLLPADRRVMLVPLILIASGLLHEWIRHHTDGPAAPKAPKE